MTIKRSWPHTRLLGNVIQAHVRPIPCEGLTSNIEDSLAIARSIRSRLSQTSFSEVLGHGLLQAETISVYYCFAETISVLSLTASSSQRRQRDRDQERKQNGKGIWS